MCNTETDFNFHIFISYQTSTIMIVCIEKIAIKIHHRIYKQTHFMMYDGCQCKVYWFCDLGSSQNGWIYKLIRIKCITIDKCWSKHMLFSRPCTVCDMFIRYRILFYFGKCRRSNLGHDTYEKEPNDFYIILGNIHDMQIQAVNCISSVFLTPPPPLLQCELVSSHFQQIARELFF